MARVYTALMTAQEVKDTLPEVNNNIPNELITQHIKIVEQMKIRALLGYDLYEQLELEKSGGTFSTANQYLLDEYLFMIISLHVQKRLVLNNSYQLENNGLRVKLSDVSDLAATEDMSYYRSSLNDDIDFLINEMKKYMMTNQASYPKYFSRKDTRSNTASENKRDYDYGFGIGKIEGDCIKKGLGIRLL
jgi:hypothetical protein